MIRGNQSIINIIDFFNIYGLILIGTGLFIGFLVRYAAISGIVLLILYYFAYPPFGASLIGNTEGHVFIINTIFHIINICMTSRSNYAY